MSMTDAEQATVNELRDAGAYADARLECDVVMKGGITSGVVYPLAICQLARRYRLRDVGGSSAGAIAAAISAAAEYGRCAATGGFHRLATVPEYVGKGGRLSRLFQPNAQTRPLFGLLLFALKENQEGKKPCPMRWVIEALRQIWRAEGGKGWLIWRTSVVAALVLAAARLAQCWGGGIWIGMALFGIAPVLLIICLALWAKDLFKEIQEIFQESAYGLCTGGLEPGVAGEPGPAAGDPFGRREAGPNYPLTYWLVDELDGAAGLTDRPLCFGDLAQKGVKLEMFTTSLTRGRPYLLPYRYSLSLNTDGFFFDPKIFRGLFPERIVKWMEEHPPERGNYITERDWEDWNKLVAAMDKRGLKPLPWPEKLPVVVPTRMSLSFPLLLSAIPLEGINWSDAYNDGVRKALRRGEETEPPKTTTNWFSDGGISSNFPIHFFDTPLPSRPTFGINLRGPGPGESISSEDQNANVRLVKNSREAQNMFWQEIRGLGGFLGSLLSALHEWNDNAQMQVHGYWDRVAHVMLDESHEGGLNLNMPDDVIAALSARGLHAGEQLAVRFDPDKQPDRPNWDSHRWQRYRTTMSMYEGSFERMARGFDAQAQGSSRSYRELLRRVDPSQEPETGFEWSRAEQRAFAEDATTALLKLSGDWKASGQKFRESTPQPLPHLRAMPPISGGGEDS